MKGLMNHYWEYITDEYVPDIFYSKYYRDIINMLDYYGFTSFSMMGRDLKVENIDRVCSQLQKDLDIIGIDGTFLMENNIYISGSTPLQYLIGEHWTSDIDMYISENDLQLWFGRCDLEYSCDIISMKMLFSKTFELYVKGISILDKADTSEGYGIVLEILYCVKFEINNRHVDLVITRTNPKNCISLFDFDFLKIWYDGYTISAIHWQSIEDRCSINLYGISEWRLNDKTRFRKNIDRIKKYTERGFSILIHNDIVKGEYDELIEMLKDSMLDESHDIE